jgi:hypothetical protein
MNPDIEKKINARVAAAFEDLVTGMSSKARNEILRVAEELVKAVWHGKIYAAMPADKTKVGEYFLDQELEQFLNEAVEECHKKIEAIADNVRGEFNQST